MAEFVSGLTVDRLSADLATLVPGHRLEDHATMHLRFNNGARGYLFNTTIVIGEENGLCFRVSGSKGGIAWHQDRPNRLIFTPLRGRPQVLGRGGFKTSASADAGTRVSAGHPEGYLGAFATIYTDIADALQSPQDAVLAPTVVDGARGVAFMFAALESSQVESRFMEIVPV